MKFQAIALATFIFLLLVPVLLSAQNSEEIFSNPSTTSPFEERKGPSNSKSDDEIYYDTSKPVTPPFFDITSSVGVSTNSDPAYDPEYIPAPIDDYVGYLFFVGILFKYRSKIKEFHRSQFS